MRALQTDLSLKSKVFKNSEELYIQLMNEAYQNCEIHLSYRPASEFDFDDIKVRLAGCFPGARVVGKSEDLGAEPISLEKVLTPEGSSIHTSGVFVDGKLEKDGTTTFYRLVWKEIHEFLASH